MKYCVRYYKDEISSVRYDIEVESDSPENARLRVLQGMTGLLDLTDDELDTERSGKEELVTSEFDQLADPTDPYAVICVDEQEA
jgi:hypothetical protein